MVAYDECPLPAVAEALAPYVKSRAEAASTRRKLHAHLDRQLTGHTQTPSLLALDRSSHIVSENEPEGLSGVRKAYWRALQAHAAAHAQYESLRAELDLAKQDSTHSTSKSLDSKAEAKRESYISLLRQREQKRKLKVVENAYSAIVTAGSDLPTTTIDDAIEARVGDLPVPPSSHPSEGRNVEMESRVLELKKAIVTAQRAGQERKSRARAIESSDVSLPTPQAEIAGLQSALQELTVWMEAQLAIIANAEAAAQSETGAEDQRNSSKPQDSTSDFNILYEEYLEARQRLVQVARSKSHLETSPAITPSAEEVSPAKRSTKTNANPLAVSILPYTASLVTLKHQAQTLLQHQSHARRECSLNETNTERLIQRLAEESRLVDSTASHGSEWEKASREAGEATKVYVEERLEAGRVSANDARERLVELAAVERALDVLIDPTQL